MKVRPDRALGNGHHLLYLSNLPESFVSRLHLSSDDSKSRIHDACYCQVSRSIFLRINLYSKLVLRNYRAAIWEGVTESQEKVRYTELPRIFKANVTI